MTRDFIDAAPCGRSVQSVCWQRDLPRSSFAIPHGDRSCSSHPLLRASVRGASQPSRARGVGHGHVRRQSPSPTGKEHPGPFAGNLSFGRAEEVGTILRESVGQEYCRDVRGRHRASGVTGCPRMCASPSSPEQRGACHVACERSEAGFGNRIPRVTDDPRSRASALVSGSAHHG